MYVRVCVCIICIDDNDDDILCGERYLKCCFFLSSSAIYGPLATRKMYPALLFSPIQRSFITSTLYFLLSSDNFQLSFLSSGSGNPFTLRNNCLNLSPSQTESQPMFAIDKSFLTIWIQLLLTFLFYYCANKFSLLVCYHPSSSDGHTSQPMLPHTSLSLSIFEYNSVLLLNLYPSTLFSIPIYFPQYYLFPLLHIFYFFLFVNQAFRCIQASGLVTVLKCCSLASINIFFCYIHPWFSKKKITFS